MNPTTHSPGYRFLKVDPKRRLWQWLFILVVVASLENCSKKTNGGGTTPIVPTPKPDTTFSNPLMQGSDPWIIQEDTNYYYTHTLGNRIALWKTSNVSRLAQAQQSTVFQPTPGTPNSRNIWAPELHRLNGKWYLYYTAGSGPDSTQRLWVSENSSADPLTSTWIDKGRIFAPGADFWAIDGTVLEHNGNHYLIWSGRPNLSMQNQNLYIARMSNPWTLEGEAVMISQPELSWERNGGPVNEGPQVLKNSEGRVFVVYSASGCWTDDYALGLLSLKEGGNPLNASDWTKSSQPVFTKAPQNNAFGPGHNAFFTSRDGSEQWIIYHANSNSGEGCGEKRNIRIQEYTWSSTGLPNFGQPVATGRRFPKPSGER